MKLTPNLLKKLIKETIRENSMLLTEAVGRNYEDLMKNLKFEDGSGTQSFAIISGQYPMGLQDVPKDEPARSERLAQEDGLAAKMQAKLDELNLDHVQIKGRYGNPELSHVINNPDEKMIKDLCEEFQQDAYVLGENSASPKYRMMKMEYEPNRSEDGRFIATGNSNLYPNSVATDEIVELADSTSDYYSAIEDSNGTLRKFTFPFFP